MKTFKQLLETLSQTQTDMISNAYQDASIHDEMFRNLPKGATRIDAKTFTMPLIGSVDKTREKDITSRLATHGITVTEYINNKATDKYGREVSISKSLGRHGHDPNLYATDPRVKAKVAGEITPDTHEVVYSIDKHHVAGMSSGRNWTSCMTLPGNTLGTSHNKSHTGQEYHSIYSDLEHGTMIAYLVPKGKIKAHTELDKDDAIARILLKKHISTSGEPDVFVPERSYSGTGNGVGNDSNAFPIFNDTVEKFAKKHWKMRSGGGYTIHPELYDDSHYGEYSPEDYERIPHHRISNVLNQLYNLHERPVMQIDIARRLAENPELDSDHIHHLFSVINDNHNVDYDDKQDIYDTLIKNLNISAATLRSISNADDGYYNHYGFRITRANHPNSTDSDLQEIRRNKHGYIDDSLDEIISKHPNAEFALHDILKHIKHGKNSYNWQTAHDILQNIISHPNMISNHDILLDDLDSWDKADHSPILQAIAKSSSNPNTLHRVTKLTPSTSRK